jgi:hypothetical protein
MRTEDGGRGDGGEGEDLRRRKQAKLPNGTFPVVIEIKLKNL